MKTGNITMRTGRITATLMILIGAAASGNASAIMNWNGLHLNGFALNGLQLNDQRLDGLSLQVKDTENTDFNTVELQGSTISKVIAENGQLVFQFK